MQNKNTVSGTRTGGAKTVSIAYPRKGSAQIGALILILLINWMVSPQFFDLRLQDGRLFGSLVDVFDGLWIVEQKCRRRNKGDRRPRCKTANKKG